MVSGKWPPRCNASAIGNYEAKEWHDPGATMTKVARFNGLMGVARDELKLLKACRARPDFELIAPQSPSPLIIKRE
jgi:hypothetical protein